MNDFVQPYPLTEYIGRHRLDRVRLDEQFAVRRRITARLVQNCLAAVFGEIPPSPRHLRAV